MALNAAAILKQTPLQQLLEDINFQRTKEMRQLLKDDSGFVVLQGTTYWTDLFVRHFLFQTEPVHSIDSDDLLFFVRKKHVKSSSRHMPKFETEVEVFRKDSRKLPIGDPDVDWEETVYLNMVIHQFDYTLTLAICTRTSPKELQVLRRHSQRVYASPSRRKMDTKGEGEEITYPHICFMVDNFDEVFSDILVRDGEMVCVELVANDKDGAVQGVIFLGSIRYDALKRVYDSRQSSLSSKVAQRMSFGLFSSGASVQTRCEFVRMKGPQGKGHAEMAVTKPKGSGVETPTSEPGFCATDMWDEWEEENEDYCTYRHQRRLSDPSANLNNFTRYSWRSKSSGDGACSGAGSKARSENEGLDSLANDVSEIEAGDLRDDPRTAFSASAAKIHTNPECEAQQQSIETKNLTTTKKDSPNYSNENEVVGETQIKTSLEIQPEIATEAVMAVEVLAETDIHSPSDNQGGGRGTTTGCGNCFGGKKCKRWVSAGIGSKHDTPQMSEVYCPACDVDTSNETPACLNKMPDKKLQNKLKAKPVLVAENEVVVASKQWRRCSSLRLSERKGITRSVSLSAADKKKRELNLKRERFELKEQKAKEREKANEKEKEKEKEKSKDKEKIGTKAASLLSKISPKRSKSRINEKERVINAQQKQQKEKLKENNNTKAQTKNAREVLKQQKQPNKAKTNNNAAKTNKENDKQAQLQRQQQQQKEEGKEKEEERGEETETDLQECEIADDATSLNGVDFNALTTTTKITSLSESDTKLMINVRGKEELPVVEQPQTAPAQLEKIAEKHKNSSFLAEKFKRAVPVETESHPLEPIVTIKEKTQDNIKKTSTSISSSTSTSSSPKETFPMLNDFNGNNGTATTTTNELNIQLNGLNLNVNKNNETDNKEDSNSGPLSPTNRSALKNSPAAQQAFYNRALNLVPKRRTPDGTNIYYWCDLPKKALKELDDGAYNPLWASRGFAQSFHFWKENRRQQSTPLNAFLTYVTLPWWSIAKDLLDHRETPILTF